MKRVMMTSAVALAAALLFLPPVIGASNASAQNYTMRRVRQPKDLPDSLRKSLDDKVSEDAAPYLDQEDRNKMDGKPYTDFVPKFEYLPNYGPSGELSTVSVKLGGAEYDPKSKTTTKGAATGKLKYLVFSYTRQGSKWIPLGKPKWESQDLGKLAAKQMTEHQQVGDHNKAITEKYAAQQQAKKKALADALQKKFGDSSQ
ncbi:MAG TPA: hypothetical protein VMT64_07825 [Candidatus Binataceae bacterium]|nr:hypothetical protein [Candidatus Binataceae bacterium]